MAGVTDPKTISVSSQSTVAPVYSILSYLRNLAAGSATLTGVEVTANKDVVSGYAGLDASALLKFSEFPFRIGWISWKDTAGTITTNGTGGNIVLSVTFRTGTNAGDYTLTSDTAFADTKWVVAGWGDGTSYIFQINNANILHSTTQLNFLMATVAALARPATECTILAVGKR